MSNRSSNMFTGSFEKAARDYELYQHFIGKEVVVLLRNEQTITGILNDFNSEYAFVSGKHIINFRYIISISISGQGDR